MALSAMALPMRVKTSVFNSRNPLKFLNKNAVNQLQNGANKKAKKLSLSLFISIINLTNKNGFGAQDQSPCNAH